MGPTPGTNPDSVRTSYTWEDFLALDEDDPRELIDGAFVEVEMPTELHEWIVSLLIYRLMGWALANRAGRVYASGYKVRVDAKRGVMPDVQFFKRGNSATKNQKGVVDGRPDLAVEVISTSSRSTDRVTKLNWYARLGVPEYWLIDPEARTLERLVLRGDHYLTLDALKGDEILKPDTFPGLEIALAEFWEEPDET